MKNPDEKKYGNGGRSAAAPVMNREVLGRTFATWLKKRLSFGRRKREALGVGALVAACVGAVCGFARNRDAN